MSHLSVKLNVVLAIAVAILCWKVFMGDAPQQRPATASPVDAPVRPSLSDVAVSSGAIDARLAAIDARLAAMERAVATASVAAPNATTPASIDPQAAAAADRRVAAMFPQGRFDHADLIRFRATLGELPAEQQAALAAAFSRAVNGDRLQSRM